MGRYVASRVRPSVLTVKETSKKYWRDFVSNFWAPEGTLHFRLWNSTTQESSGFGTSGSAPPYRSLTPADIPAPVLDEFYRIRYVHSLASLRIYGGRISEKVCDSRRAPPPSSTLMGPVRDLEQEHLPGTTHVIESENAMQLSTYRNGWQDQKLVTMRGLMVPYTCAIHVPVPGKPGETELRLETRLRFMQLSYNTLLLTEYVSRHTIKPRLVEHEIPPEVVERIIEYGLQREKHRQSKKENEESGGSNAQHTDEEPRPRFVIPLERPTLGPSPIMPLGFPAPTMRYLEITDCVSRLKDLMDINIAEGRGPLEVLRSFAENKDKREAASKDMPSMPQNAGEAPSTDIPQHMRT